MGPNACNALTTRLFQVFVVVLTLNNLSVSAGPPLNVTFPEKPPASSLANVVEDHFIGVSYELSSFDTLCMCLTMHF